MCFNSDELNKILGPTIFPTPGLLGDAQQERILGILESSIDFDDLTAYKINDEDFYTLKDISLKIGGGHRVSYFSSIFRKYIDIFGRHITKANVQGSTISDGKTITTHKMQTLINRNGARVLLLFSTSPKAFVMRAMITVIAANPTLLQGWGSNSYE